MNEPRPLERLLAGLDFNIGFAVRHLLVLYKVDNRDERKRILELCEALVSAAISMKTERKHADVSRSAASLRHQIIESGGDELALGVLSVLEGYAASVAARKLRDLINERKFRERQLPLTNQRTGEPII